MKQESLPAEAGEKRLGQDRDGRLKNILKKTYLRRWVDAGGNEAETHQGVISYKRSNQNMDFARSFDNHDVLYRYMHHKYSDFICKFNIGF